MGQNDNNQEKAQSAQAKIAEDTGLKKLSPLELNAIKLDPKHTILTPDYLDNLITQNK